jgi:hypothetical protein
LAAPASSSTSGAVAKAAAKATSAAPASVPSVSHNVLQGLFGKGESNWRVAKGGDDKWEKKRAVLARYRELHGDMKVPEGYIIPSIPDWPKVLLDRNAFNMLPRDTQYRRLTSRCPLPPSPSSSWTHRRTCMASSSARW